MATTLEAKCRCGYASGLLHAGAGLVEGREACAVPALCRRCERVLTANFFGEDVRCPTCEGALTFYDELAIRMGEDEDEAPRYLFELRWFHVRSKDFRLLDAKYYCPKCGCFEMEFFAVSGLRPI